MISELVVEKNVEETTPSKKNNHIPVMPQEVLEYLRPRENDVIVDCTMGLGGHALAILQKIGPHGRLIGIDRDAQSLKMVRERLMPYLDQCHFVQGDFRDLDRTLGGLGIRDVDGILFDLGISSFQLDNPQRGFSFQTDGPLDMRMDQNNPVSAFDVVNSFSEQEIAAILRDYGEERWHHRIARQIVRQRAVRPVATTQELRDVVVQAMPYRRGHERIHPATRTFQAIRIAVNRELESLEAALDKSLEFLKPQARIAVLAFHSLEDRIVKQKFRTWAKAGLAELIVKKPLRPGEKECLENPRARSARLRIAVKRIS
ncbi:MAG: 16S rRNA (cytosine(1402)-N(4))-methyltransferase RsmH [Candidatus Omnitrophica bacterium]|nr:16S rRNA (cytosine(1402)-N(4))-methyltransferase RsmH [Candidatus Omnitrophota bacterium]